MLEAMRDIYPNFTECSIQTFDDNKKNKEAKDLLPSIILSQNNLDWNRILDLNKRWCGIFFSVNSMIEWTRKIETVTKVNSWICEIDWISKELQRKMVENCPLQPSLIIESKSSLHLYWFAKDWTKEKWYDICNGLRNYFDWDPAVVDISRVLRVPWFEHCKNPDDRFMIQIVWGNSTIYTEEEMIAKYPDKRSVTEIKNSMIQKEQTAKRDMWWDYFWDRVKQMNAENMLEEISGHKFVNGEYITFVNNSDWTKQICANGISTGCWIRTDGSIWSKTNGWPHWTNRVFRYNNCDGRQLAQWIRETHPEMCDSKVIPKKEVKKELVEDRTIDMTSIVPFSWWLDVLDNSFGRYDYNIMTVVVWESQSGKTEFTYYQARANAKRGIKCCYLCIEMTKKRMIARIARKRAGITKIEWSNKTFTEQQKELFMKIYNELWDIPNIDMVNMDKPTIDDVKNKIIEKMNEWYVLFYVDNMWFIVSDLKEIEATPIIIRELKSLTSNNKIAINLLHHFNKGNKQDRNWPRGMESIRSSGKIENDADNVLQVWRDLDPEMLLEDRNKVLISLQKDREHWEPNNCYIRFHKWEYLSEEDFTLLLNR